uniref:Non-structural protein 3b n=1 Tax=Pheasant coronavirus TaxID=258781 RepID=Q706C3_9GAMC|nr:3b protein [Pheasant coronavirus]
MLNFEALIETGEEVVQKISFYLQRISSVLNTQVFDPFEVCVYIGGSYWELESADDFSGEDEYSG